MDHPNAIIQAFTFSGSFSNCGPRYQYAFAGRSHPLMPHL
jgi:hypothetical protein